MESIEPKKTKENKDEKGNKKIEKRKESKSKKKQKGKKGKKDKKKGEKKDKEKKSLEERLKDKTDNLNSNNLDSSLNNINNFNISLKSPIHILNYHKNPIICLSILDDGRLISGSTDSTIIIYNKTSYQPDLIINEHKDWVNCIIQLRSGIIATCSNDKTIKLFNIKGNNYNILQTLNDHTNCVNQIIEIEDKYLVSCSKDKSIIFYLKENLQYKKDYQISTSDSCYYICQIKENEICYSENYIKLCFFDMNERKIKSSISNLSISSFNPFIMILKDLLFISECNKILIININYYELIREIEIPYSSWISGSCMLDKNLLFTGDGKGIIREWKIEEDNLILISKKENAHKDWILTLLNIGNGHIASSSADISIKIW